MLKSLKQCSIYCYILLIFVILTFTVFYFKFPNSKRWFFPKMYRQQLSLSCWRQFSQLALETERYVFLNWLSITNKEVARCNLCFSPTIFVKKFCRCIAKHIIEKHSVQFTMSVLLLYFPYVVIIMIYKHNIVQQWRQNYSSVCSCYIERKHS